MARCFGVSGSGVGVSALWECLVFRLEWHRIGAHTGLVLLAAVLLLILALPLIVRLASGLVRREWEQIVEQRHPAGPGTVPIERVTADLRRLRAQLEACENRPGLAGKGLKMGALRAAYVEVLKTACGQLDIEPPRNRGQLPAPLAEIYRVEIELRGQGLDVRPAVPGQRHAA